MKPFYPHDDADAVQRAGSPFRAGGGPSKDEQAMALLSLSHTPIEHLLYSAMLSEVTATQRRVGAFSVRHLMMLTGLNSFSAISRGRAGLLQKLSIERQKVAGDGSSPPQQKVVYTVFTPEEIFAHRREAGLEPYPKEVQVDERSTACGLAIERAAKRHHLSRRQAQVTFRCVEGLTNTEIGEKLSISEKTVKFHLRHIFIKVGVKRRSELISRLLMQGEI